ncbi:hypothetical protein Bbelb_397490, partial [Branchiostoma belcheri]
MNRNEGWELPKSYLPLLRKEAGEAPVRPRVGSPDGQRSEGDPIRGRAGTE